MSERTGRALVVSSGGVVMMRCSFGATEGEVKELAGLLNVLGVIKPGVLVDIVEDPYPGPGEPGMDYRVKEIVADEYIRVRQQVVQSTPCEHVFRDGSDVCRVCGVSRAVEVIGVRANQ